MLDPGAALRFAALLFWLSGFWRVLLVPLLGLAALAATAVNTTTPGALWDTMRSSTVRLRRALPVTLATLLGVAAFLVAVGVVDPARVIRSVAIFALQVALVPETPRAAALAALLLWPIWLDARGRSAAVVLRGLLPTALGQWSTHARSLLVLLSTMALAGVICASLFPAAMQGWARAEGADAENYHLYRSFFNFSIGDDPQLERRRGFGLGLRGLTLPPGGEGEIVYRLNRPPGSVVLLKPDFYNRPLSESGTALLDETFPNSLDLAVGSGGAFRTLARDATFGAIAGGQVLDLTELLGSAREYRLRFSAVNVTPREVTVLPAFVVSTVTDPAGAPHFSFTVLAYAVAAAGAAYLAARATWPHLSGRTVFAIGALAGAAVSVAARLATLAAPADSAALSTTLLFDPAASAPDAAAVTTARLAFALVLVAGALIALIRHRAPLKLPHVAARPGAWVFVLCLVVSVVAVDARWQELMRVRYEFLLPDAVGYKAIAAEFPAKMAHYHLGRQSALLDDLYASGYDGRASWLAIFYWAENNGREPGWPALLRLVFNLLGVSAFHSRLTSLGLSALVAGLTCWLGSRTLHPIAGVLGGLFYALNPAQIANSVAGLREELVGLAFLILVVAFVVPSRPLSWSLSWPFTGRARQPVGWTRVLVAGAAGAALVLVRADMLLLAATTLTLGALALRWPLRAWLTASAIVALLAGPMYLGFWFTRLDPFYPGTYGATVNRNLEFPDRMGTPGFPTPEDYAANWAAGPPTTPFKYFFGYHSAAQFIEYTARGFIRIFPTILFRDQVPILWLCAAGAALLLATRRWHLPAIVVISLVPFYAFLAGVPNPWVFAPRYAHHALPYAVLAAGYAVAWPLVAMWRLTLSARSARPGRDPVAA